MSCPNRLGEERGGAPCGDEGKLCGECLEAEAREFEWLRRVSKYTAGAPLDDEYYADLRDAGRL